MSYLSKFFSTPSPQFKLPRLISDGMVLQRETPVRIWGWSAPGAEVNVSFTGRSYRATTGRDGKWTVTLTPQKAGGPYHMEITSQETTTIINNILIGEVWVCSGQSNMALPMARVKWRYPEEFTRAKNPDIRLFLVPERCNFQAPDQDLESGVWEPVNPESILRFTATGYFFAKTLFEKYRVPIGLINASVGGTPVQAWLSEEALQAFPAHLKAAKKFKDNRYRERFQEKEQAAKDRWYQQLNQRDSGLTSGNIPWYDPSFDVTSWPSMRLPAFWDEAGLGPVNGVVWFRKDIEIPASMTQHTSACESTGAQEPALLLLGRIVDSDETYVNGTLVGTVTYQYPPRRYDLPRNLLRPGKNTIVVRVVNTIGRGGFIKDKPYQLISGKESIDLQGEWRYKVGATAEAFPGITFLNSKPLGLYNGMIAPLINYTIKGVIWYQGESNIEKPLEYHKLFPALIADWRQKWNQGDFPFLYVQLPNYLESKDQPSESAWAELREAQRKALAIPNTAMAVAIDLGEWNDLHPLNKGDVGKRLGLAAQKVAYGDPEVVDSGPMYRSMKIEDGKIILSFTHTGSGLMVKGGGTLKHFAIAGADQNFVWANARIEGNNVVVWNDQVHHPVAVRYAWADNPETANLYNQEGLPAAPFRTDG